MCSLCDDNDGECQTCEYCSRLVCFDVTHSDDLIHPACATSSGDLACVQCARELAAAEDAECDDYYEPPDEAYMEFDE